MAKNKKLFDLDRPDAILEYLVRKRLITSADEVKRIEKAGEGNMNLTVRVQLRQASFIVKQSPPYVAKYPEIPAPEHRVQLEGHFYRLVARSPEVRQAMPGLLLLDHEQDVLVLEDLGKLASFQSLYDQASLTEDRLGQLLQWILQLHQISYNEQERASLANREMRQLNHEHIFDLPIQRQNGLDLEAITPGLSAVADRLKQNSSFISRVHELGRLYLSDGPVLLHGDYYPGSWLQREQAVYIIDPEFGFFGPKEFDLAVLYAHLLLTRQAESLCDQVKDFTNDYQWDLIEAFAGVEIMRRLIGVAQLPLSADLIQKESWLDQAVVMVT